MKNQFDIFCVLHNCYIDHSLHSDRRYPHKLNPNHSELKLSNQAASHGPRANCTGYHNSLQLYSKQNLLDKYYCAQLGSPANTHLLQCQNHHQTKA